MPFCASSTRFALSHPLPSPSFCSCAHTGLEQQFFKGEDPNDEDNWGCDPNCNNRECGFDGPNTLEVAKDGGQVEGDCSLDRIIEVCQPAQRKL